MTGSPSEPTHTPLDIERMIDVLDRHQVDYLIIGGIAVNVHGFIRAAADLDITADLARDNLRRLAAALREMHAQLRGIGDLAHDLSPLDPDDLALGGNWTLVRPSAGACAARSAPAQRWVVKSSGQVALCAAQSSASASTMA